ncbi:hypothetical protein [Embleya sp. NBC_00896]|uniref:hypothetical protein n=1 Tax=Embleya sp. NBC_00896 TaxID=2975961 RepID=UPI00386ECC8F|nr:hypothetical protein OG928_09195 [Embleya sp. NBC_00896]
MTITSSDHDRLIRRATLAWAGARAVLGVVALTDPPRVSRPWIGDDADGTGGRVFARALGGRDLALGVGALYAAARGEGIRAWALASAGADVGDAVITCAHWDELPRGRRAFIAALAGASAVAGATLAIAAPSSSAGRARPPSPASGRVGLKRRPG